ncbi:HEAT repeat domain-containing protein [candidate division KSB1 bacterium]|nr:HEAT repeat domain-containing protein [candidate division KSB1 bacterium]
MKKCKPFHEWIWLAAYSELDPGQQHQLKAHMKTCASCQLDAEEARQIIGLLDQKPQLQVNDEYLKPDREELHQRLLYIKSRNNTPAWIEKLKSLLLMEYEPWLRPVAIAVSVILGIFIGSKIIPQFNGVTTNAVDIASIQANHNFEPIDIVNYNPTTRKVMLRVYNIQESLVERNIDSPEVQKLLSDALLDADRPNVRLKTVNLMSDIKSITLPLLDALIHALEADTNPGVRMKAIRLLNTLPIQSNTKDLIINALTRALLTDENSAIRNEAIDGLGRFDDPDATSLIINAARKDSNEYVQYKADELTTRSRIERKEN